MTDTPTDTEPAVRTGPRPFRDFLALSPQNVRVDEQLGMDLAALVQEVTMSQKGGALTIKLRLEPDDQHMLTTRITWKLDKPPMDAVKNILFADDEGGLHRNDPYQRSFSFDAEPPIETTDAAGRPIQADAHTGVILRPGDPGYVDPDQS